MLWWLTVAVSAAFWIGSDGSSSLTRGFPSLEELRRNASLLERYSTHDGECRSVPGVRSTCSPPNRRLSKVTFIALPGVGQAHIVLSVDGAAVLNMSGATKTFGEFGYELTVPTNINIMLDEGNISLWIQHPPYEESSMRLLHQVGDEARNICWRTRDDGSDNCEDDYDYPLLAIETENEGCIEGLVNASELMRLWSERDRPVLYSSPSRDIAVNCTGSGSGNISRIFVGAYSSMYGSGDPRIEVGGHNCSVSTEPATGGVNVYECVLSSSQVPVDSLRISQRYASRQIGFLYDDDQGDRPLISLNISGDCSSQLLSEANLTELTARFIPNIVERNNDDIEFKHLTITQNGFLVKWTFVARNIGDGDKCPTLFIVKPPITIPVVNMDCTNDLYPNVHQCTVEPQQVIAGEHIGVCLPALSDARLLLSFIIINGVPPGESLMNSVLVEGLPLIAVEVVPANQPVSPSSTMIPQFTPQPSIIPNTSPSLYTPSPSPLITAGLPPTQLTTPPPTTDGTSDPQPSGDNTGVIVGAVMGLILAVLLFLTVSLLLVCILYRRRKSSKFEVKEEEEEVVSDSDRAPMDNPVYSGRASEPGRQDGVTHHHQYEVPTPQPTLSVAVNSAQVYEVPDKTPSDTGRRNINTSLNNPEYYSTIQDVHSTVDDSQDSALLSSNHYEMAIYVPTQEQRLYVESGDVPSENIYATLEETQAGNTGRTLSFFEECDTYWRPASNKEELYQQLAQRKYREIPKHHIRVTEHLGSGQFGTVNKGVWQSGAGGVTEVAVKMIQEGTSEQDTVRFLQEAAINGQFRHPNIVQLLGVVTVGKPIMIVLELVSNGDLRDYLLKHKPTPGELPPPDTAGLLLQFSVDVARGMEYLSGKAFVHRDLAARNILVTENKTCKISDFGMARDLEEGMYYVSHGGKVPVKWTAPEALHYKKYSTASDVWSFGCLMYEIWSLGHKPFEGYTNPDTVKLIDGGCRLAPPPGCPKEMYHLMITCWNADKSGRPQFREIVETLSQPEHLLLHIPEEVTRGHPQASILGAPLEAGRDLYIELQNTYIS